MADNIGGVEVSLDLNAGKFDQQLNDVGKKIEGIQKQLKNLSRSYVDASGKTQKGILSESDGRRASAILDTLNGQLKKLVESYKTIQESRFAPRIDTTGLERGIQRVQDEINKFTGQSGSGLAKIVNGIDLGFYKQDITRLGKVGKENIDSINAQQKALIALEKEYIKYSNLAEGAILRINSITKSADAALAKSIRQYGAHDPRVQNMEAKIAEFRAVKAGWEQLLRDAKVAEKFDEATYRNFYAEHRLRAANLYQSGVDIGSRNSEMTYTLSYIQRVMSQNDKLYDSYRKIEVAKAKLDATRGVASPAEQANIDAQIKKLDDYKAKLEQIQHTKLGDKLAFRDSNNHSVVGADFRTLIAQSNQLSQSISRNSADADNLLKQIDLLNAKEREVTDKITKLKAAQNEGLSRGLDASNNTAMANIYQQIKAFEQVLARIQQYKAGTPMPVTAFGKSFARDMADADKSVKELQSNIKSIARAEREAKKEAEAFKNAQEDIDKSIARVEKKLKDVNNAMAMDGVSSNTISSLEDVKHKLEGIIKDYQDIRAEKSLALDRAIMGDANRARTNALDNATDNVRQAKADHNEYIKSLSEEARAKMQLEDAKRKLKAEEEKQGAKTFHKDTDTERFNRAREALIALINKYEQYLAMLNQGQTTKQIGYNFNDVRREKKDALAEMNVASAVTTQLDRQARAAERAANSNTQNSNSIYGTIKKYHQLGDAAKSASSAIGELKNFLMQFAPIYGLQQTVMSVIEIGGEIEKQHIALQTIIGDIQNANNLFENIKGLALQSPFTFGELTKDVKQLAAYNVEYKDMYDTTKRLADISSGLGVSFERIALAYGQVKSRSWLDAKELRQFAYAGVPLLQSLSDLYTKEKGKDVSKSQVRKMITNREVSFEDVQRVLWEMTDEGGKFYNMQMVLSETLLGRYNKLKDAWEIMLSGFAKGDSVVGGALKRILNFFTSILLNVNAVIPLITSFFAMFTARKIAGLYNSAVTRGITEEYRKQLIYETGVVNANGQIDMSKVKQLILQKQLTTQEAVQLGLMKRSVAISMRLEYALAGIGNTIKGLWTAIGGWIGVAIGAITYLYSYISTKNSEMEQAVNQTADEIRDKYKQIVDFQDTRINVDTTGLDNAKKAVKDYVDFIKENAPYMKAEIISDIQKTDDYTERLKKLETWVETLKKGNTYAKKYSDDVVESAKDSFDKIRELAEDERENINSIEKNLAHAREGYFSDIANAARVKAQEDERYLYYAYKISKAKSRKDKEEAVLGYYHQLFLDDTRIEGIYNDLKDGLGKLADKVKSDPAARVAYRQIRESLEEGLDEEFKTGLNIRLDQKFGIDVMDSAEHGLADAFMKSLTHIGNDVDAETADMMKRIANRIRYDEKLSDAEMELVKKLLVNAGKKIEGDYPVDIEAVIKRLLAGSDFVANIKLRVDTDDANQLAKALKNGPDSPEFTQALEQYTKDKTLPEAQKSVDEALKKTKENIDAINRNNKMTADGKKKLLEELEEDKSRLEALQERLGKPLETTMSGSSRDIELMNLQKRIQAAEKFIKLYKEYVKMYGEEVAKKRIMKDTEGLGFAGYDFSDVVDVRKRLLAESQALLNKKPNDEQRKALRDTNKEKQQEEILNREKEALEGISKAYTEINAKVKNMYQTRDAFARKYGMSEALKYAGNVAYYDKEGNPVVQGLGKSYAYTLRKQIEKGLKDAGKDMTVDSLLGMNTDDLEKAIGKGVIGDTSLIEAVKSLKEEEDRLEKESLNTVQAVLDRNNSTLMQLRRINSEMEDEIEKIGNNTNLSEEDKQSLIESITAEANRKRLELSADYVAMFSDQWLIAKDRIGQVAEMIKIGLNEQLKEGLISAEDYQKKMAEIAKAQRGFNEKGLFGNSGDVSIFFKGGITGLIDKYGKLSADARKRAQETNNPVERSKYEAEADSYAEVQKRLVEFSNKLQNGADALSLVTGVIDGVTKSAESLAEMFRALGDESSANNWSDMADASKAIGSIFAPANGIIKSALSGDVSGIVSNAISAPIQMIASPITALAQLHDKKLQRQIDIAIYNQKLLQNMSNNLQKSLEKSMGGLYGNKVDRAVIADMVSRVNRFRGVETSRYMIPYKLFSSDTLAQVDKASKSRSYYDTMRASIMMQKDEAEIKLSKEQGKKNSDKNAIEDYKQEIKELTDQINEFSQEMAKSLYGIDFKSWANNFASAIVNAWASGTNAVKAYKDAVADVVRNTATSMIQQKVIESALNPIMEEFMKYFDDNSGLLGTDGFAILTKLFDTAQSATEKSFDIMDAIEKEAQRRGFTEKNRSTGLSPSIAGVTENTADLLASYINSIRAYCEMNNAHITKLAEEQIPFMSTTLSSQLAQLKQIQQNTLASANASSEIRDMIYNMTLGINTMSVKITA